MDPVHAPKWFNYHNYLSPHQGTPLHLAAEEGHADAVQCLVDNGADINIKDINGVGQ